MPSFVALLRGVNVGKAKRVPMADWRKQLGELGYTHVATLLNSGNAVFGAARAPSREYAAAISAAIERGLKISVPVVVKSSVEFKAIVAENPFTTRKADHSRVLVVFTQEQSALRDLASLGRLASAADEFVVGKHAAYLHCPGGILLSRVGSALLGKPGESATTRNWATTMKLQVLLDHCDA